MSATQNEMAARFRALHDGPGAFIIPNPWECRIGPHSRRPWLPGIGHIERCLRLCHWSKRWRLTRDEALAHARLIVDATDLPVSADLEKGLAMRRKS
jgi:2-methylisocitrate lyase-like PEP mutase family enzyme